jgi:hypothetical protein
LVFLQILTPFSSRSAIYNQGYDNPWGHMNKSKGYAPCHILLIVFSVLKGWESLFSTINNILVLIIVSFIFSRIDFDSFLTNFLRMLTFGWLMKWLTRATTNFTHTELWTNQFSLRLESMLSHKGTGQLSTKLTQKNYNTFKRVSELTAVLNI